MKKIALVTGGSRGIGRGIVVELLNKNYEVHFTYLNAHETARQITSSYAECYAYSVNSEYEKNIAEFAKEFLQNRPLNVLINNVGIVQDKLFFEQELEDYWRTIQLNFGSVLNYCKYFLPFMMESRQGHIINISSIAANKPKIGNSAYGVSKIAVERFSKTLALEVARFGIRVNCVSPGFVETDLLLNFLEHKDKKKFYDQIPLRKTLKPIDIANVVLQLAEGGLNTTGSIIPLGHGENIF